MNKRHLQLLLVFAVVCGSGNSPADVLEKFRTQGGTECEQSYDSGQSVEFGFKQVPGDGPRSERVEAFISYKLELGRSSVNRMRAKCNKTMYLEEERMVLENERLKLELELLKRQVSQPEATATVAPPTADANDW